MTALSLKGSFDHHFLKAVFAMAYIFFKFVFIIIHKVIKSILK